MPSLRKFMNLAWRVSGQIIKPPFQKCARLYTGVISKRRERCSSPMVPLQVFLEKTWKLSIDELESAISTRIKTLVGRVVFLQVRANGADLLNEC